MKWRRPQERARQRLRAPQAFPGELPHVAIVATFRVTAGARQTTRIALGRGVVKGSKPVSARGSPPSAMMRGASW